MKIRNKLALCFLLVMAVPALIIAFSIFVSSRNIISEQMRELAQKNLQSTRLIIQYRLFLAAEMTTLIYTNPAILGILTSPVSDDPAENLIRSRTMDRALNSYVMSNYFSADVFPILPRLYLKNRPELVTHSPYSQIYDLNQVEREYWYHSGTADINLFITIDTQNRRLILGRKLYDIGNVDLPVYTALLTMEMSTSYFNGLLKNQNALPGSRTCVLNEHGTLILSSDPVSPAENYFLQTLDRKRPASSTAAIEKERAIIVIEELPDPGWTLVNISYLGNINLHEQVFTFSVIVILVLCFCIAVSMAFVFSNTISKPIVSMVNSMKTVGDNNFQVDIDYRGDDEFGYLFSQYKSMISQIRDLIDKLYISEMHKQRAEIDVKNAQLEALQTQINPHFLYNTLDSINLYAIKYNAPVICEMIDSLANFFRYTLSGGRAVISLDEEITHTKSYLKLQSLRMGGSLRYHFDIPGELRSVRIVKLTIQPLVENSIKHGFDTNKGVIEIDVSARRENDAVKIIIQDNGTGADISRLEGMLARDGHSASFAVGNVHNRIQNTFGREYGLSYQKREGGGLSVEIRIPLYSGEGEGSEHS